MPWASDRSEVSDIGLRIYNLPIKFKMNAFVVERKIVVTGQIYWVLNFECLSEFVRS